MSWPHTQVPAAALLRLSQVTLPLGRTAVPGAQGPARGPEGGSWPHETGPSVTRLHGVRRVCRARTARLPV